ncbi:DUF3667 domain-containing protein [Altererythrobacter lutimaris]|uniref:DUF3667 domain-containing protein n=1 Tax=Altererythrobacter lutimaris TaxID=2743979 RepID=A0A850HD74_9SPHN|nr:DUF3667 domain-containing protein [Altererythrobacter lutimaris]NVE95749.1 DUF3667 domain-containing protein [Altererythrobacter lutimaris]
MSDITDGLGTAVEGGLLAKAVEPEAGDAAELGEPSGKTCDNCATPLLGPHCHACGQKGEVHRSLAAIGHEILHGVLHLDGKIWRTLPLLMFKPGKLTRRYIDGERAKFVSPMAMFLFSVFLMFAIFQALGISAPTDLQPTGQALEVIEEASENASADTASRRAELMAELEALQQGDPRRAEIEAILVDLNNADKIIQGAQSFALGEESADDTGPVLTVQDTDVEWLQTNVANKWRENPGLMLYKMQANAYKFSWLLIPLSIPFVWLLFAWKRRFKAYDHAVFVTYSIAFMSLLFIVLSVVTSAGVGGGWAFTALVFIPPFHIYKQLRHTYGLSRFSTLWRLVLLFACILIVALLFFQALLLLGAF